MNIEVDDELAVVGSWYAGTSPTEASESTLTGFLWALSLVTGEPVAALRVKATAPVVTPIEGPPIVSVPVGVEATVSGWPGLGMSRINRVREVDPDSAVGEGRAFTAGPDGRPVRLAASYADMAGFARDLSGDMGDPETGVFVPPDTTT